VENSLLFLTRLADSLSLRVQGRHSNEYNENNSLTTLAGSNSSAGTNANSFNPTTGLYTPGIVYASASPYATTQVVISPTFNRSGSRIFLNSQHDSAQVDLHHEYRTERVQAQTLFGYAYNYDRGFYLGYALTAPAVTLTNFVYSPDVVGVINRTQQYYSSNNQAYVSEKISLLNKRVILDGSYSRDYWDISIDDRFQGKKVTLNPSAGLVSYGLVVKPRPDVDFFYTHSQNAAILPIANLATAPNLPIQNGVMDEEGMRVLLRDNRIRLTLSHYEILQNNTNVSNPANFAYPPPVPALPGLLTNRVSRGWEFEAQGAITKELSLVCAYTNFKNRNPFGQQFRGVAERTASALLNYSFDRAGKFKGLATSVGVDYECKRAGDDATGFTSMGVPRATTFYLPARTLVNVTLSYEFWNNWRVQTYIDNVLNQEYLAADLSRGSVWAGTPRNLRAKLTYKF
jgi:iron complex outermembrane receptor protein